MYKFTYYFREGDNLREIAAFTLPYEDAVKYMNVRLPDYTQERFEKGFTHSDEHPCTIKEGEHLRLRITKEN